MSTAASSAGRFGRLDQLRLAREIIEVEADAVRSLAGRLGDEFCRASELLFQCRGSAIVSGMGKAGLVGQKIAATLASTGTRSHFLHPGEALHGDLGRVHPDDVLLVLSQSGQTEEIVRLLPELARMGVSVIGMTGNTASALAGAATVTLDLGPLREACSLGLAPSTSTTAMLALGDALALVVSRMRGFKAEDFARYHPGGSLGRKLSKVEDVMRPLAACRAAGDDKTVREILVAGGQPGRRTGAIMLTDSRGVLTGVFTDSDLARLLESRRDADIDRPIREVMTAAPTTVPLGTMLTEAVKLLAERKISELPVVAADGKPVGLIDITDVVGILPREVTAGEAGGADQPPQPAKSIITGDGSTGERAADEGRTASDAPKTLPFTNKRSG